MTEILRRLANLAHRIAPKRRDLAVIWGWPDHEDSVIALEQALQKSPAIRRIVILTSDLNGPAPCPTGHKTRQVKKNSLTGFVWFTIAKYVFFTHPCFTRQFPKNVISVNIWHGMPIKKIGRMIQGDPEIHSRYALATSPFWADIMKRTIASDSQCLPIGLPRNDRLFSARETVLKKLHLAPEGRVIAWLPTYRKSIRGLQREDGKEAGNVFGMPDVDAAALNDFLKNLNARLFVKPHPMAATGDPASWSNITVVDNAWLADQQLSLYEFLAATDLLISDVSSVVIDYLLLDRPVIHAFSDLEEYKASRGFTVEPIEEYFCGPVVTNQSELISALDSLFQGADSHSVQRAKLRNLSHADVDPNASTRLLNHIGL